MPQNKIYTSASESCHQTALRDASDGKSEVREAGDIKYLAEDSGWSIPIRLGVSQGVMREALKMLKSTECCE